MEKTSKYRPTGQFYEISDTIKKPRSFDLGLKTGAPSGARTLGTLIKSQVLYQLS